MSTNQARLAPIRSRLQLLGLILIIVLMPVAAEPVAASDSFDPGRIIDDSVLSNSQTMSVAQIQAFLESKVQTGVCDRNKTNSNSVRRGLSPPWTCLFEFMQNPATGDHNYGQFLSDGRPKAIVGGQTAAELIYQAAADNQINPQVLITLLQKQQRLVTDNWPWPVQYSRATGWTCPATDPCSDQAAALSRQLTGIARQIRTGLDNPGSINFRIGSNQIAYNPKSSCGTATVNIVNQATAVLYSLEPYTPNQAALDNLYGSGDDCSVYGWRNFWVQFAKWFQSSSQQPTTSPPAASQPSQPVSFNPGRIIDDSVLSNSQTMSVAQIQAFLESKVQTGVCDRNKTNSNSVRRGLSPPWTCLFEFMQNPATGDHNYGQFDNNGRPLTVDGGQTAAELIYQAAADNQINPQVLITLLQKQQRLVTDNWPWPVQYSRATGWTCPATDPCSDQAAALSRQLTGIAKQIRAGLDNPDSINFRIGSNQIAYNPKSSCGTATVNIVNQATAVLYSLEPYTPNQAALDNLYGSGDDCSVYGWRNFWVQFAKWFQSSDSVPGPSPPTTPGDNNQTDYVTVYKGYRFDPGHIISDANFTNQNSMTVGQIQKFLEDQVIDAKPDQPGKQCNRWRNSANNRARNYTPPWTCLFEFMQNPTTGEHNFGRFDVNDRPAKIDGALTAAELIHQAATRNQINPQVLLVILQKEQSLITDNWPWPNSYSKAAGWACPDTAPCDPRQASFHNQIMAAAAGLRRYLDNLDQYWYRIGSNQILYHPNRSCGQLQINIRNAATVGLYLYTPYTPNSAALQNLHGVGDNCSAYGNRNFWVYYINWFGDPHGLPAKYTGAEAIHPGVNAGPPISQVPVSSPDPPDQIDSGDNFNPGNLLTNSQFRDASSLNADQIQTFLQQKLTDGDPDTAGNQCHRLKPTTASGRRRGFNPPWTCLFEFRLNPTSLEHNYGRFDDNGQPLNPAGSQSVGTIIAQAASDYQVNPRLILAILELEQNLITDNWPWSIQIARAGGLDCQADRSDCDPDNPAEFIHQIRNLARQLDWDFTNSNSGSIKRGISQINYHPNDNCGSQSLNLVNAATVALYRYQPYSPNQTGLEQNENNCSYSYWYRFFQLYRDWFS